MTWHKMRFVVKCLVWSTLQRRGNLELLNQTKFWRSSWCWWRFPLKIQLLKSRKITTKLAFSTHNSQIPVRKKRPFHTLHFVNLTYLKLIPWPLDMRIRAKIIFPLLKNILTLLSWIVFPEILVILVDWICSRISLKIHVMGLNTRHIFLVHPNVGYFLCEWNMCEMKKLCWIVILQPPHASNLTTKKIQTALKSLHWIQPKDKSNVAVNFSSNDVSNVLYVLNLHICTKIRRFC